MYKVSLFNNNVETIIHYPSSDQNVPHVDELPLTEELSVVDTLSFSLYSNNPGYQNVYELTTVVKVKDIRDDSIRFTGRIFNVSEKMDNDGKIYKDVSCEGALSFLNDTKQRGNTFATVDIYTFLNQILTIHNNKVESYKRIFPGFISVSGYVAHTCEFKTTLAELLTVKDTIGGEMRVREDRNVLYLDWITSFSDYTVDIRLGTNMKDMVIGKDLTTFGTRVIPLGANNLTIESVNGGIDYLEDTSSKNIYGLIETTVEYKDIDDASTLLNTCANELHKYTQPLYSLTSNALDLSYITGIKQDQFTLGIKLHLINPMMGIDSIYTVVKIDLDLLTPYNPKLTISNASTTLNNTINDLRNTTIQNNGVYNNVQIGSAFGIRAVRSDNKVITTINATDGISIENNNKKVFSVDIDGNIITNDITANDMKANRGTFTDIYAEGGEFNKITATDGIVIEDGDSSCKIDNDGVTLNNGNFSSKMKVALNSKGNGVAILFDDDLEVEKTLTATTVIVKENELYVDGVWIQDYIVNLIEDTVKPDSLK
jgi:hypothetical protein